jgi:hypothetical protein
MIPRVKPEGMLFGKPVSTTGPSPGAGFIWIMLGRAPLPAFSFHLTVGAGNDADRVHAI